MDKEITAKVKGLLALKGKKNKELAEYMGITAQSLQNKFNRGSFSADDLIKIAAFADVDLAFVERGTANVVLLDESCVRPMKESAD